MSQQTQKVKKEHYVPQSYLERFAKKGKKLFVYDKYVQRIRPANIRDVAEEKYFYDIPEHLITEEFARRGIHPQIIEKILGNIEAKFKRAIDDVLACPIDQPLDKGLRGAMCYFLAIQLLRTRDVRNVAMEMQKKFLQTLVDDLVKINFPEHTNLTPRVELKHESLMHIKLILDPNIVGPFADILHNHIWLLGVNKSSKPLYTSDTPIVRHHWVEGKYLTGWDAPGIEIVFPLNPYHILILRERTFFNEEEQYDGLKVDLNSNHVEHYNRLQVIHSHRQIYSLSDDFDLAKKVCKEKPEVCQLDSNRVEINLSEMRRNESGELKKDIEIIFKPRGHG